jgi:hypothetical protein
MTTASKRPTSAPETTRPAAHRRSSTWFAILIASLAGLAAFSLIRPAFEGGPYYRPRGAGTTYAYWYLVVAASVPYLLALRAGRLPTARSLLIGAGVLFAAFVPAPALQSQDIYQYLLYGKMAAGGVNPYVVAPATTGDPWLRFTLWDSARTVYGPLWTAASAATARLGDGGLVTPFIAMKLLTGGLAVGAAGMLAAATRREGDDGRLALFTFAFNPLVVVAVGLGAHADAAVAAAIAGAMVAHRRGRALAVTLLLTVAALVKAYAALALVAWLVVLLRRRGGSWAVGHAAAAAGVAAVAFEPFWAGADTFSGYREIGEMSSASLVGSIQRLVSGTPGDASASVPAVSVVAGVLLVTGAMWILRRRTDDPWRPALELMAVYVLLSPWFLPWHLIGPVALASVVSASAATSGVLAFSGTSMISAAGGGTLPPTVGLSVQTLFRYGPPLLAAWRVRPAGPRSRPAGPERSAVPPRSPAGGRS